MTGPDRVPQSESPVWLDSAAGPVVRPYAVTRGRSGPRSAEFDLLTFVLAVPRAVPVGFHPLPEHRKILARASEPVSVAELASHLDLALGVVRLLLGDLADADLITVRVPTARTHRPESHVLKAVINGLRAL